MLSVASAVSAVRVMASHVGKHVTREDDALLASTWTALSPQQITRVKELLGAATDGFFFAAARSFHFSDPSGIKAKYGYTLKENYPEAGEAFLGFATSYWTMRSIIDEVTLEDNTSVAMLFLRQLDQTIRPLFFPMPGSGIPPHVRAADQRRVLLASGAPIDIEEFLKNNPILIRDKQATASGCAPVLLFCVGTVLGLIR